MSNAQTTRRPYGSGYLYAHPAEPAAGERQSWYGQWRTNGRKVKRRLGWVKTDTYRDGLTKTQAEAEMRRLMAEVTVAKPAGPRHAIEEVGEVYLAHLDRLGRKKSTRTAVESTLRVWLVPTFAGKPMSTITHDDVADLVASMEDRGLSPKSIHNYVGTLSALFSFAMGPRRRWATENPCQGIELPAVQAATEIHFLELDEVEALVTHALAGEYEAIDRALYRTAAMTGLREGELIALRWRDVDWNGSRIRVRQNYVLDEFGTPKSKRSTRSVPMAPEVGGELDRLFKAQTAQGDDDLVFADPMTGGPLSKAGLLRRYRKALKAAKLDEGHRFHDLRHTFGTRMAAAGVPMRTLQEFMGHRDIATTQRYSDYAPSPAHERDMVAAAFAAPRLANPTVTEVP